MDIPTKDWSPSKKYSIDDIVRVWNLALPPYLDPNDISDEDYFAGKYVARLGDDGGNYVLTDAGEYISTEIERGEIFKEKTVTKSTEVAFGLKFPVDPTIGYTAKAMVRKNDEDSDTIDPFLTHIELSEGKVDMDKSIGVGVGIKFYDSNLNYIQPENQRMTVRPMASSELSHTEWYRVQLDIEPKHIPPTAEIGEVFIFLYGIQKGGFDFRKVEATNLSKFFYCTEDHLSSPLNMPGGSSFWTQDFNWRPSYGSSSSFAAINEAMTLGEGSDYSNNLAINSLPMELSLSFKGRTDKEAKAIVHFLQEKHFAYESIFALDYRGSRLLSSDVQSFNFIYTHPYRKDLKFTCVDFSHSMDYRNNNTVSARFVCNTESSIRSVESHSGYNERIDAVFPAYIDKDTDFVKGKKMKLNSFSLEEGEDGGDKSAISLEGLISITPFGDIVGGVPKAGLLSFSKDQDLKVGDCIYVNVLEPEDSIYSIGLGKIFKVIDSKKFVFGKGKGYVDGVLDSRLLSEGSADDVSAFGEISTDEDVSIDTDTEETLIANMDGDAPVEIKKLFFCPEDCLASQPILPDTECGKKVSHKVIDPATGEYRKRVIMLKNYRKLQLETDIDAETFSIDVVPLSNFTLTKEDDFQMLIPAVCGRSSIYIEDPDKITKYPWIKIRNFEHKPTLGFNLANKPKHHQSNFLKFYNKKYKKSINQNMSTFSLTFDKRDDEEAAEILQFLESHLGYKKFRFTMPRPYLADDSSLTTQSRSYNSVFYCPSWDHQLAYKNNHTITATFIESSTGLQEDFANPEGPCLGAKVYDPVTEHSLCTFSSVATATHVKGLGVEASQGGETAEYLMTPKDKTMDLIFVVDSGPSVTANYLEVGGVRKSKYQLIIDSILKSITGHDDTKLPLTESYGGLYDVPAGSPPWADYNDAQGNSLYDPDPESGQDFYKTLKDSGYDIESFKRFNVHIEENRINIGICIVGHGAMNGMPLSDTRILDLPDYPNSFDKKFIHDRLNNTIEDNKRGKEYLKNICDGISQLYNSNRSSLVSERYLFLISDFNFNGNEGQAIDEVRLALRSNEKLAKRRPVDSVLDDFAGGSIREMLREFSFAPSDEVFGGSPGKFYSYLFNPDFSADGDFGSVELYPDYDSSQANPDWYSQNLKTVLFPVALGQYGEGSTDDRFFEYAEDYRPLKRNKDIQMCYEISNASPGSKEAARAINFFNVIGSLSYDSGAKNMFSINIKNCGPNDIKIHNTIANFLSDNGFTEWETERIKTGIPKDNEMSYFEPASPLTNTDNMIIGYGGQYRNDPNNEKFLASLESNTLWHNFNTEYEVWRKGVPHSINGGWEPEKEIFSIITDDGSIIKLDDGPSLVSDPIRVGDIKTKGVQNIGVAFKDFPARVFKSDSGLELIDYNIGNISEANNFHGDYNHIPILKEGESIDLFFGFRVNSQDEINEEVELFFNTEDLKKEEMGCYARFLFKIKSQDNKEVEKDNKKFKVSTQIDPGPGPGCRVCFSGGLMSAPPYEHWSGVLPPFVTHLNGRQLSDIFGGHEFDSVDESLAELAPNAMATTFDSIFVDTTTRVKVYGQSDPANVKFDAIGPFILSNAKWAGQYAYYWPSWPNGAGTYEDEEGNSFDNYWKIFGVSSQAHFTKMALNSESDMHSWPKGRIYIECRQSSFERDEDGELTGMPSDYCYEYNAPNWVPVDCYEADGVTLKNGSEDKDEVIADPNNLVRYGIINR